MSRAADLTILALALAAAALVAAAPRSATGAARADAETFIAPHVDRPIGRVSADRVSLAQPLPLDVAADAKERPYHCLVRLLRFPDGAAVDVPQEAVRILGAEPCRRVAPGEYLFERIPVAHSALAVERPLAPEEIPAEDAMPRIGGLPDLVLPRPRKDVYARRNPLPFARHALTVCELWTAVGSDLDAAVRLRGIVVDRTDGRPLAGARIACAAAGAETRTGADGAFAFEREIAWRDLLAGTTVVHPGHLPVELAARSLVPYWVERWRSEGIAAFALMPEDRKRLRSRLIPSLAR